MIHESVIRENEPLSKETASPPSEFADNELSSEELHTDPGPGSDEPAEFRDWNNAEDRYEMIAEAAYYKAEQRGFEIGEEELDWLEAEQELIDQMGREPV